MSLHIKEWRPILTKVWNPWNWKPIKDTKGILNRKQMMDLINQIFQEVEERDDGFLEIDKTLSKVVQLWPYRIVIVHPPLSDGLEMTIVKPIRILGIEDYNLNKDVIDLFQNKSKGILIAGSPWSGKTTFAQALVDLYLEDDLIIKTIESPRDLLVSDDVVQYSFTYGSHDDLRDILLLSRPDFTVYDEVRNKPDFDLYKDLRLTGIGLIWVIHATKPVDSIQRFLWTIEMWIIPQVIDTVIFIDKWKIGEILQLELVVKVPHGMFSEDLARPVIQVKNFFTNKPNYEIYTFGEQIVVVPVDDTKTWKQSVIAEYAQEAVNKKLQNILPCPFLSKVRWTRDLNLYVPSEFKANIIWRAGKNINELEKEIWLKIHVFTFDELPIADMETSTSWSSQNWNMSIQFPSKNSNQKVTLFANGELFSLKTNEESKAFIKKARIAKSLAKKWFLVIDLTQL